MLSFQLLPKMRVKIKPFDWFLMNCQGKETITREGGTVTKQFMAQIHDKIYTVAYIIDSNNFIVEEISGFFPVYLVDEPITIEINHLTDVVCPSQRQEKKPEPIPQLVEVPKRRGRKPGAPQPKRKKVEECAKSLTRHTKLEKGTFVIGWTAEDQSDFLVGTYQGSTDKVYQLQVGPQVVEVKKIQVYEPERLTAIAEKVKKKATQLKSDLRELNSQIRSLVQQFESEYKVKLSEFEPLKIEQ